MTSKIHGLQLESNSHPLKVYNPPDSLETTEGTAKERFPLDSGPTAGGSCDQSHSEELQSGCLHLFPQELCALPQERRQSWRRASMKDTNRRKSLPPFHQGITGGVLRTKLVEFQPR